MALCIDGSSFFARSSYLYIVVEKSLVLALFRMITVAYEGKFAGNAEEICTQTMSAT